MPSSELARLKVVFALRDRSQVPPVERLRSDAEALARRFPPPTGTTIVPIAGPVPGEWVALGEEAEAALAAILDAELVAPGAEPPAVVVYLHGGGYVYGRPATTRDLAARLAAACGCPLLVVDYRLAPEHPFPAAVDDAAAAVRWLRERLPAHRLIVGGDSAGGALAVATLLALAGDPVALQPSSAGVFALSPWADLTTDAPSLAGRAARDPVLDPALVATIASLYLAGADPRTPLASPLHAELGGLPPLFVQVGSEEILFDAATGLADRARAFGVDVTLEVWEGMVHGWQAWARVLPEGDAAIAAVGAWVRGRLGTAPDGETRTDQRAPATTVP